MSYPERERSGRNSIAVGARSGAPFVVIATKGRCAQVVKTIDKVCGQSLKPIKIVVVGASHADLPISERTRWPAGLVSLQISPIMGLCAQRNVGLDVLLGEGYLSSPDHFVVFFDDDFLPADNWLSEAAIAFANQQEIMGLTGWVLADGINGDEISAAEAEEYLIGNRSAERHWSRTPVAKPVESLYGCNMAFRAEVSAACRFDEQLLLYGWQEDCDYSGQARRFGSTMLIPQCRGVHLGVKSARVSGARMGYSQIANPIHIVLRGNMPVLRAARFMLRSLAANAVKSIVQHSDVDYRGRLRGSLAAIKDLLCLRLTPTRILHL